MSKKYLFVLFCWLLISPACSPIQVTSYDEPLSIRLNQKRVNLEKGIKLSRVQATPQHYLSLEVHDTTIVRTLNRGDRLQIMLASGSRPVATFETNYEVPYQMGFDATKLFEQADSGDRLIFFAVAADSIFYMMPIVQ